MFVMSLAAQALILTISPMAPFAGEAMLGDPDLAYILGGSVHACYAKPQIEVIYDGRVPVPGVLPLHGRIPRSLGRDTRAEMSRLQGWWKEDQDGLWGGSVHWFNGDRVVFIGGGIALGFYYELDVARMPHVLQLYYPDAKDDGSWKAFFKEAGDEEIPRRWVCKFEGTRLLMYPESMRGKTAEKEAPRFKRMRTPKGFGK